MNDTPKKEHTEITNFRRQIERKEITPTKVENFRKFLSKQPPESDDAKVGKQLLQQCEEQGAALSTGVGVRSSPSKYDPRKSRPQTKQDTNNAGAESPKVLGEDFHNPYTFIPFPDANWFSDRRSRRTPTPLTMDEVETDRFTGVIDVEVETMSPLLTCSPDAVSEKNDHKAYKLLRYGKDVVMPSTGVRGSLRSLMSIIAGGTLGYLDDTVYLCQGRDCPIKTPFLARVVKPGSMTSPGIISLGQTKLVKAEDLEVVYRRQYQQKLPRPGADGKNKCLWAQLNNDRVSSLKEQPDKDHCWQVKLSGRPIKKDDNKKEGVFLDEYREIDLPAEYWAAYLGRYRHADHPELKENDLVWLEPADPDATVINSAKDIVSLQWARWGRKGERLLDVVEAHAKHMLPDSMNPDGKVDEITDLFGQVPLVEGAAGPFAARIRPENLVFKDVDEKAILPQVTLAPLQQPHPGCAAFYRKTTDADAVTNHNLPLRGFKVYRTTKEDAKSAPWLFETQGVYDERGQSSKKHLKINKTCDLLQKGQKGKLRIACRSLSKRELALMLLACSVDWRMGGGKPLGLGWIRPRKIVVKNEEGQNIAEMQRAGDDQAKLPEPYAAEVKDLTQRSDLWNKSQQPVAKMRYPRAVQRGGHVWFQRHASPKKSEDLHPRGIQVMWAHQDMKLGKDRVAGQLLPRFNANDPTSDVLYGYDLFVGDGSDCDWVEKGRVEKGRDKRSFIRKIEPFDLAKHVTGKEKSGGFHGQNAQSRRANKERRRG